MGLKLRRRPCLNKEGCPEVFEEGQQLKRQFDTFGNTEFYLGEILNYTGVIALIGVFLIAVPLIGMLLVQANVFPRIDTTEKYVLVAFGGGIQPEDGRGDIFKVSPNVEIIGIDGPVTCQHDFGDAYVILGYCGAFINNRIIMCGGTSLMEDISSCYSYDKSTRNWDRIYDGMNNGNGLFTSNCQAVNDTHLWVSGGAYTINDVDVDDTFLMDARSNEVSSYVDLPEANSFHHIVPLGDDRYMLVGGDKTTDKGTYIYTRSTQTWTQTADLNEPERSDAASGYAIFPNGTRVVITAAGEFTNTAEAYNVNTNTWYYIASLPVMQLQDVGVVQLDNTFLIVGGEDGVSARKSVFMYDVNKETWVTLPEQFQLARRWTTALKIPADYLGCVYD